ncbi:hypothetical protein PRZ48_003271 [Zasmidium cellare]|uniref:Transposase n=1 Tax=Zasmidium cellare TaxID=395010 RepID=A0ABR0EVW0_ZASCE|nr:hypothetical protein PRZ48_003271 [Zasmidium cellare]
MNDCERISRSLNRHHDGKFGFVVWRCSYANDADWARFMERLTKHVHTQIDADPLGHKIKDHFAWDIMDNKEDLDGATKEQVRKKQNEWTNTVGGIPAYGRYTNGIYADQEVIDSVLNGDAPESTSSQDFCHPTAFVKVLDDQFEEQPEQLSPEAEPDDAVREKINSGDEGCPPVEVSVRISFGRTSADITKGLQAP